MAYRDLKATIDALICETAQFVPMAFHTHSPGSFDWGQRQRADGVRNDRARLEAPGGESLYLDELAGSLRIACVTDHMNATYACRLAAAAAGRTDITIFPGMEVNCSLSTTGTDRIHLFMIFPPVTSVAAMERVFASHPGFPVEAARTHNDVFRISGSLASWVECIHREGGMLVLAHVDESGRGHRARFRAQRTGTVLMFVTDGAQATINDQRAISEEYKTHIADCGADAIEIMNPQDRAHYVKFDDADGRARRIPCVIRSDGHCFEDIREPERFTYVKVSKPDFDGVREALRFFETRVRFRNDLPAAPSRRVTGLRLRSAGQGLFNDAVLGFNPNLNCIIGPRGCGKSTVIEALRYALGCNPLLDSGDGAAARTGVAELVKGIQAANLADTIIEVLYDTGVETHCLAATFDGKALVATEAFTLDGDPIALTPESLRSNYPVRIYSWSEMENLGRRAELQRDLIDRLIPSLPEYLERRSTNYATLSANRKQLAAKAQELNSKLTEDRGMLKRYREYKEDFDRVNTPEVAGLFEGLDLARDRLVILEAVDAELAQLGTELEGMEFQDTTALTERVLRDKPASLRAWWDTEVLARVRMVDIVDATTALQTQVQSRVREKRASIAAMVTAEALTVQTAEAAVRERMNTSPQEEVVRGRREQSKKRFDAAEKRRQEYLALWTELQELMTQRGAAVSTLEDLQNTISGARSTSRDALVARLNEFRSDNMIVSIQFNAGQDRRQVVEYLRDRGFLSQQTFGQYKVKRVAERAAMSARPTRLGTAILARNSQMLGADGRPLGAEDVLTLEEAEQLVLVFNPFLEDADAGVTTVDAERLEKVATLQEQHWDDELRILLNDRPVDQLSPGQRSSAMLPLVALSEDVPLVIDQPEDNLDNRMVGTVLTRILAELKERRQIIVATHNPNIVVGGDAEQVIVLDAVGARKAAVLKAGCIDNQDIVESVVGIMEGGKDAFEARSRRYAPLFQH